MHLLSVLVAKKIIIEVTLTVLEIFEQNIFQSIRHRYNLLTLVLVWRNIMQSLSKSKSLILRLATVLMRLPVASK